MRSQSARIIYYLATGRTLTPLEALQRFGCLRLSARILDLRNGGHRIVSDRLKVGRAVVARYRLAR
jgi:hypothetical protein